MVNKWIDKKTSLKAGKKIYLRGDIVPDGLLSEKRLKFFKSKKMIEESLDQKELELIKKQAAREAEKEKIAKEKMRKMFAIPKNAVDSISDSIKEISTKAKKLSRKEKKALEKRMQEKPEDYGGSVFDESEDEDLISPDELEQGVENEL